MSFGKNKVARGVLLLLLCGAVTAEVVKAGWSDELTASTSRLKELVQWGKVFVFRSQT